MKYLDTAFGQLAAAWKLYNYALDGNIDVEKLDTPITFKEGNMMLVLPDKIFDSNDDFIIFLKKNLSIHFGAAAITLNRAREEMGMTLPLVIASEADQLVALVYQIRNAFAHDISEPKWNITSDRYKRRYDFSGISVDLREFDKKHFAYEDIGGPEALFRINDYACSEVFPNSLK